MKTYLLAWNPKKWNWTDFAEMSEKVTSGDRVTSRWSCGNSKNITKGDRVFFIRLGENPKGIFASGIVLKGAYVDQHWNSDKVVAGRKGTFVELQFDCLLDPETDIILPRELLLNDKRLSQMHWDTQMSGVSIPENVASELEKVWESFSAGNAFAFAEEIADTEAIYEGALRRISVNSYERNPDARRRCISHYGTICVACGFDFAKEFGEVGRGLIHVHHLKELSEIGKRYQVDPIRDLRPVCPNCHAIIHRRKPAYSIEEVKLFLLKRS